MFALIRSWRSCLWIAASLGVGIALTALMDRMHEQQARAARAALSSAAPEALPPAQPIRQASRARLAQQGAAR